MVVSRAKCRGGRELGGIGPYVCRCLQHGFFLSQLKHQEGPIFCWASQARLGLKPMRCGGGQDGFVSLRKTWGLDLFKLVFLRVYFTGRGGPGCSKSALSSHSTMRLRSGWKWRFRQTSEGEFLCCSPPSVSRSVSG